jgi:signal transduction histidine kinase
MANGILHNVGNALNSVNVSASIAADRVVNSKVGGLSKAMALLDNHEADLANFLTSNPKGQQWVTYLRQLAQHLIQERTDLQEELKSLKKSAEHANEIIAFQQDYAKTSRRVETVNAIDLVEDALRMNVNSLARHHIEVVREYSPNLPRVTVQKHGVLQILVNLIQNAKKACEGSDLPDKRLILSVTFSPEEDRIRIDVHDSGVGIPSENLARIFTHGFTTRKNGHGFGLHSGARIAKELGGSLTAHSEGVGKGSTFTLEFPSQSVTKKPANVRCVPL